ncbi:uncharacterized protein Dvir_GJ15659 [Drosophila virilis]|uniref:Amun n=1 Tax=Drosophila virilis TaxID=7244 RepID=B4MAI7_DROVI|nr:uncharacterized protein Dvir_GJ15659 [Drosophila virilis]
MSNGKATASFFENGSTSQFEYCYQLYPQVLKMKAEKRSKKPQELIRLDQWYQNELPGLIKARGKDAHLVYDELVQAMKWKQSRGKFYPQLSYLVKVNTPRAVIQETKKAFRKLPNLEQAITALSNLKGVGTTMASALLTAAAPDSAPFMADECLMAIPEIEGIDYTTKEYLNFVQHIQATVERLNAEVGGETPHWSPHRVELALWAHYVANDLSPELLEDMPPPGAAAAAANTNGSLSKTNNSSSSSKVLDGEEDTNDGVAVDVDEESLGAGGRNTATESETENENTNPLALTPLGNSGVAKNNNSNSSNNSSSNNNNNSNNNNTAAALQDGDSNFVSNDSTSQEPNIDDNTTQTTATTSTEDGDGPMGVATPLASDSESNLEAPLKSRLAAAGPGAEAAGGAAAAGPGAGGSAVAPSHNNNKQFNKNGQSVAQPAAAAASGGAPTAAVAAAANGNGNGNGNGVLAAAAAAAEDEDDDDVEDDDELEADESNSSGSNLRASKLQHLAAAAAAATTEATALTAPSIGQKRTALHCELDGNNASAAAAAAAAGDKSPELKKLRSD